MSYDKNEVKDALTDEDIFDLLEQLGAEPRDMGEYYECRTICHGGDSRKLYVYLNTRLCHCYTQCGDSFDIFELIQRVMSVDLNTAINYVVNMFNLYYRLAEVDDSAIDRDEWKMIETYEKLASIKINDEKVILPEIPEKTIEHYPQPRILPWEQDHISKEVCDFMEIRYDPVNGSILIPHYDENDRLIGIRQRTLLQEEEQWGKYRPWSIMEFDKKENRWKSKQFNHPLAFNLYGLNKVKDNIQNMGIAIVFESEKSALAAMSFLGTSSSIGVAVCGSSISKYQFRLLKDLGINELCIAFDNDWHVVGDEDWQRTTARWEKLYSKFKSDANISFLYDKSGMMLPYKSSPTDQGKEVFMQLWRDRIFL